MSGLEEPRGEELPEHSLASDRENMRAAWRAFRGELGNLARALGLVHRETKGAAELVVQSGRLATAAAALGLADEDADEVAEAWHRWARERGLPRPYGSIRRALVARALGEEWRPDPDAVDGIPDRG